MWLKWLEETGETSISESKGMKILKDGGIRSSVLQEEQVA
jgi:hypothetical protein